MRASYPAAVIPPGCAAARTTGRRYSIKLEALDDESLRELRRLVRDLDHEKQMAVQQARLQPWRR